ncbi:sigma-70 family RNA polymerase sigma factor [Paenibacillus arenilitoris]|uniref:Sigma-70 family RNA polymerase sigma factor n=1 Tax=Paenibacillus arenilitoris TaxID=2772299 RepID=A0A927CJ26_9BACL|nr:sigma-70 family RNA polymerase sigma factor [Paenibacillus arenilitoris]MBD2868017.1 sigma-70 family RNA polymerase sigma factor [Paenibacillus arenilitoris]
MNSNSSFPDQEQINELIQAYQQSGCNETATKLLRHFEPVVKIAAGKMARSRPDLYEDLYQVGQMAMLQLLQKYDCSREIPFEGYAMKSVIGHLKNYLRDKSWYIQVPRRLKEKSLLIQQAVDHLTTASGRSPKMDEIAEYLGLSVEETIEVMSCREAYHYVSLDAPLPGEGESAATIGDFIGDDASDYTSADARLDLEDAMKHLKREEQEVFVLACHYGISQRDIAKRLNVSQMSVSRIQRRAIDKLKKRLADDGEDGTARNP